MGIAIPQVITSDRASGAQIIDGSLKFDSTKKTVLHRTFSAGNNRTWTFSMWTKKQNADCHFLSSGTSTDRFNAGWVQSTDKLFIYIQESNSAVFNANSVAQFRDNGWYHIVIAADTTKADNDDRIIAYVNGDRIYDWTGDTTINQNASTHLNNATSHAIGNRYYNNSDYVSGMIAQTYLIEGQQLGPESFGFTDPLTNTWKPKKYVNTTASPGDAAGVVGFGTNGFYLPMDGNSPIGQDKSGQGNDFTPQNFGGSVILDNPIVSGARPILNTTQGGTQAGVGVFGSKENVGYAVTVYNDGGGNKYYIDGVKQATLTGLIRGATYTFDQSDSSNSSHPLVFGSTAEGNNFARGALYGSISAGSAGAATTITIPYDAPETLYYHCSAHSGMGSSIVGIRTDETKADQYASNCTLALPLVGSDDDVCASIACTANNKTPTNSGVTTSTAESNFYRGSHYWSAATDTLQYAEQGDELVFGTGDFTIECWLYDDDGHDGGGSGRCYIFDNRIGGSVVGDPPTMVGYIDSHNEFNFYDGDSTITFTVGSTVGKWWHYAVTREGTTTRMFIDGIEVGSSTSSTNFTNNGIGVGRATDGGYGFAGYIQDFRVYRGLAKYTSNFVVPATFPDILPDTPSGVSGGSKLAKITDGSVAFDGDSDYLSSTGPGTLAASSNWCMECTFYCTGTSSGTYRIMGANESSESSEYLQMRIRLGQYQFYTENANTLTGTAAFNKWTHMALTKSGTTVRAFVDGKQLWSTTDNNADDITTLITGWGYGSEYFPGFISNARFVNGSSVYTSEFDPPVVPLTNITNTTHLFCQSNTSATAAAVGTITANGTAAASGFNPFNTDINTVRGQETGYPTMNPLAKNSAISLRDGNLRIKQTDSHGQKKIVYSTAQIPNDGKWYVEWHLGGPACTLGFGMNGKVEFRGSDTQIGTDYNSWGYEPNGNLFHNGNQGGSYGASSAGDVIGMTIDTSGSTITAQWYENGNLIRNSSDTAAEFTGIARSDYIVMMSQHTPNYDTVVNFGQKPFKFPPPEGYQSLNAANTRPVKVISRPDQYVGVSTWMGDGNTGRNIKKLQFKPDFVWIKQSSAQRAHALFDSVRGANNRLQSNSNGVETTHTDQMSAFINNGFTVEDNNTVNVDGGDYVAWCWKAGGDKNTFNIDNVGYSTAGDANMGIADLNSSVYNQSQVWSDSLTSSSGFRGSEPVENAFDGDTSTICSAVGSGIVTFTSPVTFSSDSIIRVIVHGGDHTVNVNGGDNQTVSAGSFQTITGDPSNNPFTITFQRDAGGSDTGVRAIEIGGKILVDSDQTPTSVPTIAASGCSVGTKQGFSIIKYTGTGTAGTIPHGLSEQPKFVMIKDLKNTNSWAVQHVGTVLGTGLLKLDVTNAVDASVASAVWNSTAPTSSVFSVGTAGDVNYTTNTAEYIAYLWHDVPGLQKFGVFKGNGNANGIFVELGFKPAILLIKNSDNTGDWIIWDSERNPYNPVNRQIWPYTDTGTYGDYDQVASNYPLDFLSNGFKMRTTDADMNDGSRSYIYCAWAEAPSVNLFGGGANAR